MKNNLILLSIVVILFVFLPFRQADNFSNFYFGGFFVSATDNEDEVKDDIKDLKKERKEESEKLQRYEGDVNRLRGIVYNTQKDIEKTETEIETVEETIKRKEKDIENLNKNIEFKKIALKKMVREVYYNSEQSFLFLLLKKNSFFESVTSTDNFLSLKKETLSMLYEINQSKKKIKEDQEELAGKKEKHEDLLWVKEAQKSSLVGEKRVFEQKVQEKKLSITEINAKISKLKSTLSSFLGESFDAKDIVDAVKFASKKTGVRKEFLMAMLDKETDLGRFTGGCTYKNTKIRSSDKEIFKDICEDLGYNYKKMKVSCALSYGYGGAMGVAQFMPSTWIGYEDAITGHTGHKPPDPWDLSDGVVGMAEKLKRAGGSKKSGEHHAAKVYYCGGPNSAYWNTHCEAYADTVKSWSKGYDEYF